MPRIEWEAFKDGKLWRNLRCDDSTGFVVCGGIVVTLQLVLGWSQLGSQLPTTAGWFLAAWAHRESLSSSEFPFPDLSVAFEGSLGFLGRDPFWTDQLYHLVLWLIFSFVVFAIAARVTRPQTAAVATSCVLTAAFAQPGNLISGYFESHVLLAVGGAFILSVRRYSYLRTLVGIFLLTLSVFVKQTGLAAWFVVFVAIFISCVRVVSVSQMTRGRYLWSVLSAQILSIFGIWFLYAVVFSSKNLVEILSQPFRTGGKAVNLASAPKMAADGLTIFQPTVTWFFGVAVVILLVRNFPRLAAAIPYGLPALLLLSGASTHSGVVFLALWLIGILAPYSFRGGLRSGLPCLLVSLGVVALGALFVLRLFSNYEAGPRVFEWTEIYDPANRFVVTSFAALAIGGSVALFFDWKKESLPGSHVEAGPGRLPSLAVWGILSLGLLSGGVTLEGLVLPAAIGASVGIELLVGFARSAGVSQVVPQISLAFAALVLVVTLGMARNPYNWMGIDGAPSVAGSLPSGESVSSSGEESYDKFQRARLRTLFADFDDQPVLFGPRNIGLSVLDTRIVVEQPCLILWWDVCSDESARRTLELFREGHFRYAVWTIEPESSVRVNVDYWRSGKLDGIAMLNQFFMGIEPTDESILLEFNESLTSNIRTVVVDLRP